MRSHIWGKCLDIVDVTSTVVITVGKWSTFSQFSISLHTHTTHLNLSHYSYISLFCLYDGRGIAWSPAAGKAISELVLDGHSRSVDLRPFDPARYTPKGGRGGRGRKKKGLSVGEQW